ncbi:MAG: hypothetical protein QXP36_09315 [Conexivisphaerales archaeon]
MAGQTWSEVILLIIDSIFITWRESKCTDSAENRLNKKGDV